MRVWSLLYAISLLISSITSGAIASSIYRHSELRISAVRFIFFFFFFYLWLWSLFRGIFYVEMFIMEDTSFNEQFNSSTSEIDEENFDALGIRGVAQITNVTRPWLSFILVMGDTFLMASSLWMFPLTREVSKLARNSMDRGIQKERITVRKYGKWMHLLIGAFFISEAAFTVYNHGFNRGSYRLLISGNMIQAIGLVYVTYTLFSLKWAGRKYENVNGQVAASPLYTRIKKIMIVYGIFSFQYQIMSLVLLMSEFKVDIPPMLIGLSTLLFNNSGTALSIVMGCSQECFVRSFKKYLPPEYTEAFYLVSDPYVANAVAAAAANGYRPPLKNPVFVFTDIESSSELWGIENGSIMRLANEMHDDILRGLLSKYHGYEITTCGDAFQLAFHTIKDAVDYCIEAQCKFLTTEWPKKLHNLIPATQKEKIRGKVIFNGLRVRMGIHDAQENEGVLVHNVHPVTGKITYTGVSEVIANEMGDIGNGGQVLVTKRIADWLQQHQKSMAFGCRIDPVGHYHIPQMNIDLEVFQILIEGLEARRKCFTGLKYGGGGGMGQFRHSIEMGIAYNFHYQLQLTPKNLQNQKQEPYIPNHHAEVAMAV